MIKGKEYGSKYKLELGAIVETAHRSRFNKTATLKGVNAIHEQQEKLIANNEDIILASSYPYDRYVPAALDYEEETYIPSECYYENGKKLDIEEAFRRVCLIVDFDTELNNTSKTNAAHYTAAALSQIGKESAILLAKNESKATEEGKFKETNTSIKNMLINYLKRRSKANKY